MICFHPQKWPFVFPYVKILNRTFCNYAFYSPPVQTNYKSCKTQLRLRNVKWFAPQQTETDTQMLKSTHSLLLHTHALRHIYTVLLSCFTSLSCPLSLTPFHAAVTGHSPTNLPCTCALWQLTHVTETHSTHVQLWQVWSQHKIKTDPYIVHIPVLIVND